VPRGFYWAGPLPHPNTQALTISNVINPLAPNRVELDIDYLDTVKGRITLFRTSQLPLRIDKLHASPPGRLGRTWGGLVSAGGSVYSVNLEIGRKAPAAARASILLALSAIHRAR
jgi:hypothetical protein